MERFFANARVMRGKKLQGQTIWYIYICIIYMILEWFWRLNLVLLWELIHSHVFWCFLQILIPYELRLPIQCLTSLLWSLNTGCGSRHYEIEPRLQTSSHSPSGLLDLYQTSKGLSPSHSIISHSWNTDRCWLCAKSILCKRTWEFRVSLKLTLLKIRISPIQSPVKWSWWLKLCSHWQKFETGICREVGWQLTCMVQCFCCLTGFLKFTQD